MNNSIAGIPKLLFMIFVYVADVEKDITPDEVKRIHELVGNTRWTKSMVLRAALELLRGEYGTMWASYVANALPVSVEGISEQLTQVCQTLTAETNNAVREALAEFVRKVHQGGTTGKGNRNGVSGARLRAKREVERMLKFAHLTEEQGAFDNERDLGAPQPKDTTITDEPVVRVVNEQQPGIGAAWTGGRIMVRCTKVTPEAPDVKTYTFVASPAVQFVYKPGQFVTLELPMEGRVLRRSYTISSSPTRPYSLSITVKRVPKGWVSNWLWDTMAPGMECTLQGPFGDFTCMEAKGDKLLLLAGGSGITPMMSMLRYLADTSSIADIAFVNNVRTPQDIIFEHELRQISAWMGPALQLSIIPNRVSPGQAWCGPAGAMTERMLVGLVPDIMEREIYLCGPNGYMQMVRSTLGRMDYPMQRLHQESFGGITPAPALYAVPAPMPRPSPELPNVGRAIATSANAAALTGGAEVVFSRSQRTVSCVNGDVILDVADSHGITLERSCRSGVCGTCKLQLSEGAVLMGGQAALSAEEVADGCVLACMAQVHGRVVIDA